MVFQDLPIRRKMIAIMMLTSIIVLLLTSVAFTFYDLYSYRKSIVANLSTAASIMANKSVEALATTNHFLARQVLTSFQANAQVQAAALYDGRGDLLAHYPAGASVTGYPVVPASAGHQFTGQTLVLFEPVLEQSAKVGTLYVRADTRLLRSRLRTFASIAGLVLLGSIFAAYALTQLLQSRVTRPILELAETAKRVAERDDYSARAPVTSNDELGQLTEVFNRMLERVQENRARLAGVIDSAMDAIISIDQRQIVTGFNAAAERMFRCPVSDAIGKPLDKFIPARFREAHRHHVEQFGHTGVTNRAMGHLRALSALRSDGEEFPIEASISQVEVAGHRTYTVILRDITERQRSEERILELNAELERRVEARTAELIASNRELEAFTYSVAHDLRAPLRHIDAFSKILQDDFASGLPTEAHRHLETIRHGSRNMSRLVDDLLNLARVGRAPARHEPVDLNVLLEQARTELKEEFANREVEWRLHALPLARCDAGLIKQVFTNLLANALKYTRPKPRAAIEVGCIQKHAEVALFVRDNGVGFDMKYADKLFGVFQRLHRSEEFEGTGVGLAIVDRIIRKHGGRVWAAAIPGGGAVFCFTLSELKAWGRCGQPHPDPEAGPLPEFTHT